MRGTHPVAPHDQAVDDLVVESLQTLWPATVILTWAWTAGVMLTDERHTVQAWLALALLLVAIAVSRWLAPRRLWAAIVAYVGGLTATITLFSLALQAAEPLYLYSLVVLIVALLLGDRATWYAALGCTGLILAAGGLGLPRPSLAMHIAMLWLTAFTAWLGSRRLLTALAWALNMTREAQRNAQQAQDSRAQAQLALKSLDDAFVRLERTTEALMFAREAAEKAYRFKADFVANVSHELRTPLNLIVGFSEMMVLSPESYGGAGMPSPYRGDLMAIYRSAKHLSDLINDVLDLSQIEAGRMPLHREPADLGLIVKEAVDIVRGWAEARQLKLVVEIAGAVPPLQLDHTRIRQVLLNLLTNATRFTDQGGIHVRVRLAGLEAVVEVQDSGPGIPQENLARAFEAFGQLGSDQAREGSGLGLAISRKFVALHGGRMWIDSELGQGTTVGFALPLPGGAHDGPPPALVPTPRSQVSSDRPAVIVRQGDSRLISLLERHVDGYAFVPAPDAASTSRLARESSAVAVIQDTPADSDGALPPHTAVLSCPLPSLQRLGHALGAAAYLAKPVTRDLLLGAVAQLASPPRSVLVVDDDPDIVRLLSRILRAEFPACQVIEAFNGGKALDVARSKKLDLVLLDLLMPGVSGYDMLRELAAAPGSADTPVIVISARPPELESARVGGELRLSRPAGFTATEIVQLIGAALAAVTQSSPSPAAIGSPYPGTQPG